MRNVTKYSWTTEEIRAEEGWVEDVVKGEEARDEGKGEGGNERRGLVIRLAKL